MDEKSPTVSVIIPTYNRAHLLGRSIRSVLNQTYHDFEIIIVDDASSDNTEELIRSFGLEKIKYIRHEKNRGAAAARNTGIKAARGNYIAFQDSDDEWLPEKLEKQMNVFETAPQNVGVVYTGFHRINNNKVTYVPYSWVTKKDGNIYKQILFGNFVSTQTILTKKEHLERVGMFDENLPRLQDWELVIRLSEHFSFIYIDEALCISYHTADSISTNQDALIKARMIILEKHYKDFAKNKKLLATHYSSIGSGLCLNGDIKNGRGYFLKALKVHPFNYKIILLTFLSLFGKVRLLQNKSEIWGKITGKKACHGG